MRVYFKLKENNFSKKRQTDYIRYIIEETCKLNKLGLQFIELVNKNLEETDIAPVILGYSVKETAKFDQLSLAVEKYDLHNKFIILVVL